MMNVLFGITPMPDVQITTGGFNATTVEFTALTPAGQTWLNQGSDIDTEAILCTKTQAQAGIEDAIANGLKICWN